MAMEKERLLWWTSDKPASAHLKPLSFSLRFSLLLLEPNEIYFEDFLVSLLTKDVIDSGAETAINDGHLKMCSKSIVFDPKDRMSPILKIHYRDCDDIYQWPVSLHTKYDNVLAVR